MPRKPRSVPGGTLFHVLNHGVGRRRILDKDADYAAFEAIVEETLEKCPLRICGYCLMPNHWHFVMWPEGNNDLGLFVQRLSVTRRGAVVQPHDSLAVLLRIACLQKLLTILNALIRKQQPWKTAAANA